jgi:hypothetical protein
MACRPEAATKAIRAPRDGRQNLAPTTRSECTFMRVTTRLIVKAKTLGPTGMIAGLAAICRRLQHCTHSVDDLDGTEYRWVVTGGHRDPDRNLRRWFRRIGGLITR